ncbi:YARHG domain-containing protein [bacterium]|nr:YARHG domain-containing protein [bacterium]
MSVYKKTIILALVFAIFLFCNNKILLADSIADFKQKDLKAQVEFINSMSKQEKLVFLKKLLPGSCFFGPPDTFMKFLSDGRALNNCQGYFYTRWSITSNIFKLEKEKPSDPFPEFKNEYAMTSLTAENGSSYHPSLWLRFSNSKDEAYSLQYSPECMGYFKEGSSEYERYKKSLTPQELARLEKLNPPIKPSAIVDDEQSDISNYAGIYDFGVSEHWTLVIVVVDGKMYVQSKDDHLSQDGGKSLECHNFNDIEIHRNKMKAKTAKGKFVIATIEGKNKTGLLLNWERDGKEELGKKYSVSLQEYLSGKYPETYLKRLDERDLANKTKQDLIIMRNEVYARYGYQFRPNGSMDRYFRSQSWYNPRKVDPNKCLTEIEKENIQFIKQHE